MTGAATSPHGLDTLLDRRRVLVCVGSGGVGKTTTSAAIALRAATKGMRAIVLTVDPARRLANALGMSSMPNEPVRVETGEELSGELWAQMLDTKATFDGVVMAHAPDAKQRDAILQNPFYQRAASSLPGSHEYMAMEQLLALHHDGRFDLVVLDTPPSTHAMDFLDAPSRLHAFLDSAMARALLKAAAAARGPLAFFRVSGLVARGLARFIGTDFFSDLLAFIRSFEGMFEGFRERAARVQALLRSKETGFVVVHAPEEATLAEAELFDELLGEHEMRVDAFVANRVHLPAGYDSDRAADGLRERFSDLETLPLVDARQRGVIVERILALQRDLDFLSAQDSDALARIDARAADRPKPIDVLVVPHFDEDLHDLAGLRRFAASAGVSKRSSMG